MNESQQTSDHELILSVYNDDEDDYVEHSFPCKFEVCHDCEGHGTVLNESMRNYGYSAEEFNRDFDDEEQEHYFKRGGMYDVQCPTCKGLRVEKVVDKSQCSAEQKELYEHFISQENERARDEREDAAIRRMESGGYD